ncbi:MAG: thioredoxin family protein [Candidatus Hydrogenedentes bacterium]|nr:thioredoxin family protein [Candidatus Hydrogenedentota bacterium]
MPRPPLLRVIDWEDVLRSGADFDTWMKGAESPENRDRMAAALDAMTIDPDIAAGLKGLKRTVNVVAIAEDWCGDVVRHVPALQAMALETNKLRVRFVTREQYLDVFTRFLTNGGEAIPKFIFISDSFVECGNWGPMPEACRKLIARGKGCGDVGAARKKVAAAYEADPGLKIVVRELFELVQTASADAP